MENSIFKRLASFFMGGGQDKQKETKFVQKDNNHGRKRNAGSVADKNAVRPKENIDSGVYRLSATKIQTRSDLRSIRSLAQGLSLEQWGNREVSEKRRQFAEADRLVQAAKQNGLFVSKPELHSYGNRVNVISGESEVFFNSEKTLSVSLYLCSGSCSSDKSRTCSAGKTVFFETWRGTGTDIPIRTERRRGRKVFWNPHRIGQYFVVHSCSFRRVALI